MLKSQLYEKDQTIAGLQAEGKRKDDENLDTMRHYDAAGKMARAVASEPALCMAIGRDGWVDQSQPYRMPLFA